jgi:hemolysin activation/secretion protein
MTQRRVQRFALRVGSLCLLVLLPLLGVAQQAPLVTPRDLRPEQPETAHVELPEPALVTAPENADSVFVVIGDVEVVDGFHELAAATEAHMANVRGKRVSAAELYRLAAEIEGLYRNEGYLLVRVTVPPQSLGDGETLKLQVIDGFIETIDVENLPERTRRYVARSLAPLVGQRRLEAKTLERTLTLAGRAPGLRLRSAVDAGEQVGGVRLILDGEHEVFGSGYSTNNRMSEGLGEWDHAFRFTLDQPIGFGEQIYAYLSGGPKFEDAIKLAGERRVVGGGVTLPLGYDGLSVNLEYTNSKTAPGNPAIWFLRLESHFERYSLRVSYPLMLGRRQSLTLTTALDAMDQQDLFPEFGDFVLSEDRLRVLRLSSDWSLPVAGGSLSWNATFSKGIDILNARDESDVAASGIGFSRPEADPEFFKFDTTLVFDYGLPYGLHARTLLRGQVALDGVLPSAELFSLDGEYALSTFASGALSSDAGWSLREEVMRPVTVKQFYLSPYLFGATGRLSSRQVGTPYGKESVAFGIGLRAYWRSFDLALEYGHYDANPHGRSGEKFFIRGGFRL